MRKLLALALLVLVASALSILSMPVSADQVLGNSTDWQTVINHDGFTGIMGQTDGYQGQPGAWSNFFALDLNPQYALSASGVIKEWHWYASDWVVNAGSVDGQTMSLMLWRPQTDGKSYQLVGMEGDVKSTAGVGLNTFTSTHQITAEVGDVLGYYVPLGTNPILALNYRGGSGGDCYAYGLPSAPYVGMVFTPGDTSLNRNGDRSYLLNAVVTPEPGPMIAALGLISPAGLLFRRRRIA